MLSHLIKSNLIKKKGEDKRFINKPVSFSARLLSVDNVLNYDPVIFR